MPASSTIATATAKARKAHARARAARLIYAALDQATAELERARRMLQRAGFKDAHGVVATILRHDPRR